MPALMPSCVCFLCAVVPMDNIMRNTHVIITHVAAGNGYDLRLEYERADGIILY